MDRAIEWFEEAPEGGSGAVAQDGTLAAGEHSGHPASVPAQTFVPHGVDAAMNAI